jgi:hypothetical protein
MEASTNESLWNDYVEELNEVLTLSDEVQGVKNYNEHFNCTKQECGAAWD